MLGCTVRCYRKQCTLTVQCVHCALQSTDQCSVQFSALLRCAYCKAVYIAVHIALQYYCSAYCTAILLQCSAYCSPYCSAAECTVPRTWLQLGATFPRWPLDNGPPAGSDLCCTAICCTALHCTALHYIICCTALYNTLHCTIQYGALHYTIRCTARCTVIHHTVRFAALHSAL